MKDIIKKNKIMIAVLVIIVISIITMFSINSNSTEITTTSAPVATVVESNNRLATDSAIIGSYSSDDLDDTYDINSATKIKLNKSSISTDGDGVSVDGNLITINMAGTYVVSGTLSDGQIIVDVEDDEDVKIVLNGATIVNTTSSPIFIKNCDKTVITLAKDTTNTITDTANYVVDTNNEPTASIYSKSDLTINGEGSLIVNANYNNGIESNDDLKIVNGKITINSVDDGILGKDSVSIKGGSIDLAVSGDGIKSTNEIDDYTGYIVVDGGTINITAGSDGVSSTSNTTINDCNLNIFAGGGSNIAASDITSTYGIKSDQYVFITSGMLNIDSSDDSIHSNNNVAVINGSLELASGDDGIHADNSVVIENGSVNVSKAYEGIEGLTIVINNGVINIVSSDDGINSSGGVDSSNIGFNDSFNSGNGLININGGTIVINAGTSGNGDGLDANGSIEINGSTITINTPANPRDYEAVDYDVTITMTDGSLYVDSTLYTSSNISSLPSMHGGGPRR